eukprot:scaffold6317_cov98-Phaeocystis_antarctica.AAC.10
MALGGALRPWHGKSVSLHADLVCQRLHVKAISADYEEITIAIVAHIDQLATGLKLEKSADGRAHEEGAG